MDFDRIDRKILEELQREGRLSMTELAERVSLSVSPCTERVRRLERSGVILGYHARVNPEALGRGLLVFVELTLASKSADVFDAVSAELRQQALDRVRRSHVDPDWQHVLHRQRRRRGRLRVAARWLRQRPGLLR